MCGKACVTARLREFLPSTLELRARFPSAVLGCVEILREGGVRLMFDLYQLTYGGALGPRVATYVSIDHAEERNIVTFPGQILVLIRLADRMECSRRSGRGEWTRNAHCKTDRISA